MSNLTSLYYANFEQNLGFRYIPKVYINLVPPKGGKAHGKQYGLLCKMQGEGQSRRCPECHSEERPPRHQRKMREVWYIGLPDSAL